MIRTARSIIIAALLGCALAACSADAPRGEPSAQQTAAAAVPAVSDGAVDLGDASYRVIELGGTGSVTGRIVSDSATADSVDVSVADTSDLPHCVPPARARSRPHRAIGAVVWIADVKAGKPTPVEKRAELSIDDCELDPMVQAIVVGTTVNVVNDDRAIHTLVFTREGTNDTLTTTPFFNAGQIVPSERLAKVPGLVDVTCIPHPSTHGYLAVFAHPYFAVTDRAGAFTIDSLPPGSYTLMVWKPGNGRPTSQRVDITVGGVARAEIALSIGATKSQQPAASP